MRIGDLLIVASSAQLADYRKHGVPENTRMVGFMGSLLGWRPRIVLVVQDHRCWAEIVKKRVDEWFKLEVTSRLRPGSTLTLVESLNNHDIAKIAKLLRDHPDDSGPVLRWVEKNLHIVTTYTRAKRAEVNNPVQGYGIDYALDPDKIKGTRGGFGYVDDFIDPAVLKAYDPYTTQRGRNAGVECSPGIALSIPSDTVPAVVLARRAPKHIVVPTDLDDHLIPDDEPSWRRFLPTEDR